MGNSFRINNDTSEPKTFLKYAKAKHHTQLLFMYYTLSMLWHIAMNTTTRGDNELYDKTFQFIQQLKHGIEELEKQQ